MGDFLEKSPKKGEKMLEKEYLYIGHYIDINGNCGSDTAPDLVEVNILEEQYRSTYEELYECHCGCRFVALVPRVIDENTLVHKIIREGNSERWV